MHLVPAPAVRLMKRRVQSRPGVRQEIHERKRSPAVRFNNRIDKAIIKYNISKEEEKYSSQEKNRNKYAIGKLICFSFAFLLFF